MALKTATTTNLNSIGEQNKLPLSDLNFDTRNPRLVEYGDLSDLSELELIKLLWKRMAVDEVLLSIATDGFWSYEPLIVCKEDGKWVVIEGNRRLAAIKILLSSKLQSELSVGELPKMTEKIRQTLDPLPVLKIEHRQDIWRYLGFKHVNGPAKWRSYLADGVGPGRRLYRHSDIVPEDIFQALSRVRGHFLLCYHDAPAIRNLVREFGLRYRTISMRNTHHEDCRELLITKPQILAD
jgi:hypothetical protein